MPGTNWSILDIDREHWVSLQRCGQYCALTFAYKEVAIITELVSRAHPTENEDVHGDEDEVGGHDLILGLLSVPHSDIHNDGSTHQYHDRKTECRGQGASVDTTAFVERSFTNAEGNRT